MVSGNSVDAIARVLHTNDVDLELIPHLLKHGEGGGDVLSIGVEVEQEFGGVALEVETGNEVEVGFGVVISLELTQIG
jgi:hypothetical protein